MKIFFGIAMPSDPSKKTEVAAIWTDQMAALDEVEGCKQVSSPYCLISGPLNNDELWSPENFML